jgi:hypothetical protein
MAETSKAVLIVGPLAMAFAFRGRLTVTAVGLGFSVQGR